MSESYKKYLAGEFSLIKLLDSILERVVGSEDVSAFNLVRGKCLGKEPGEVKPYLAVIGDCRNPDNLVYVIGKPFGSKAFSGLVKSAGGFRFDKGLKEFDKPGELIIYQGNIPSDVKGKALSDVIKLIDSHNSLQ